MKNLQNFEKPSIGANSKHALKDARFVLSSRDKTDAIRNYCMYILAVLLTCNAVFGEIKNGYEKNISGTKESLSILREKLLTDESMTSWQRRKIQSAIATLVNHVAYYDLTDGLLSQFKIIAPELYAQVDTVKDRLGRPVDVYIKFVPVDATSVKAWGLTYIDQSSDDKDAYQSEYGKFTVSVKVWIVRRALLVLAHELGHVKYQVPNLASYYEFHKTRYDNPAARTSMGHGPDDPSGQWANQFGKTFQKKYADFLKISTEKVQNPLDVLVRLKRNWNRSGVSLMMRPNYLRQDQLNESTAGATSPTLVSTTQRSAGDSRPRFMSISQPAVNNW
ncbi:MAG TPA: hypothetical protein VFZ52_06390 [Chryseolinea sp.]